MLSEEEKRKRLENGIKRFERRNRLTEQDILAKLNIDWNSEITW